MTEKTDAEWHEFCRPFVYLNGSHEFPNYPALCRAVWQASRQQALGEAAQECFHIGLIEDCTAETGSVAEVCMDAIRSLASPIGDKA